MDDGGRACSHGEEDADHWARWHRALDAGQGEEDLAKLAHLPPPLAVHVWNNGVPQASMGYWLKSFNKKPPSVPGVSFSVPQINNRESGLSTTLDSGYWSLANVISITVPLTTIGLFIVMAFI